MMMASSPTQLCRLCLLASDKVLNVWETFEDLSIASILEKHFWFQIQKSDGLTEWLCQLCWTQTKTFHEFYVKVERYHKYLLDSADSVEKDTGDTDETVDGGEAAVEPYLDLVEIETELKLQTIDTQISEDDSSDCKDGNDSGQSEIEDVSGQHSVKKIKICDDVTYQSGNKKLKAQIRNVFTMKCEMCTDVEFESLSEVTTHYRNIHKTKGYLMCCGKKFWPLSQILDHIRYHNNAAARHQTEEDDARIREFFTMKCDVCSEVEFKNLLDAKKHYRKVHKTRGYITCCGRNFWRRFLILDHIRYHINPGAFHCDKCKKSFINKDALIVHMGLHVPLDSRAHKCKLCSSSFTKESVLKNHVKAKHLSKTGEKFPCDKCDKNFRSKLLLACHIRNVHESLEHVCETCARLFKTKHILANHIITQHSITQRVQCDICGTWSKHKLALQKHVNRMHADVYLEALNCPVCNKSVKNKHALNGHMKRVHGERCHQCALCDKAFKNAKILKEHIAGHTGEYLYNCPYCEKKFNSNANMYSHRKKIHSLELARDALTKSSTNGEELNCS